jgi:uncharacterized protein YndB with AHSA1/START domain
MVDPAQHGFDCRFGGLTSRLAGHPPGARHSSMRGLVAAGIAVIALALLPVVTANADVAPAGTPVITPPLAGAVVDDLWPRREKALVERNALALDVLETDAAAALDEAWINGADTGLAASTLPRTIAGRYVLVPRQLSYPASFIAVIVYARAKDPNWVYTEITAFVRSGPAEPWKLAVEAYPPMPKDFQQLVQDPQSDDFAPAPANNLSLQLRALPVATAHHWPGWKITPDQPGNVYGVGLANGSTLACFGIRYQNAQSRPWWHPLHLGRADLGLPAGYYRSSVITYVENRCVLDQPAGYGAPYREVAHGSAYIARSGVPAQPMPWLPVGLLGLTLTSGFGLLALRVRPGRSGSAATAARPAPSITLKAYQRDNALRGLPLLLGGALAVVGIEQLLIEMDLGFAIALPIVLLPVVVIRVLKGARRLQARATVIISKPPDEVFAAVADTPSQPAWWPEITEVVTTSAGPPGVGTTYRHRQRLRDGRLMEIDTAVTDSVPGRRYATRLLNGWYSQATTWTFEPVPEGTRVEVIVRLIIGPIQALSGLGFRQGWQLATAQRWEKALADLQRFVEDGTRAVAPAGTGPVFVSPRNRLLAWLEKRFNLRPGWLLSSLSLAFTTIVFAVVNPWFAVGFVGLLVIHEFAHFVQTAADGRDPQPPVFLVFGAFVMPRHLPTDAIVDARGKVVGPLMATVACAGLVTIYAFEPGWHLLPWICAGAAVNLLGSVAPSRMLDSGAIMLVIGRWLPLSGLAIGIALAAGSIVIGVPSLVLIPAALFCTIGLSLQVGDQRGEYWASLRTRGRLAFAAVWTVMVLYLCLTGVLALLWL